MMLRCTNLGLVAGDFSLSNISFDLEAGAWGTIMGPTGCGKSTLIEGLCGLRRVQAGRIEIGGKCVTHVPPRDRGIGVEDKARKEERAWQYYPWDPERWRCSCTTQALARARRGHA